VRQVELAGDFRNLSMEQRELLREWYLNLDQDIDRKSLWIAGPRRAGSSYIAKVAMLKLIKSMSPAWEWLTAKELIDATRTRWTTADHVKHHPDDYSLWMDNMALEAEFDFFWREAQYIAIDNFHDTLDVRFWRRFIQPDLEARLEARKPVILATNMLPDHREFADITRVIESYFVVCRATR
jgi:hypothetical protein